MRVVIMCCAMMIVCVLLPESEMNTSISEMSCKAKLISIFFAVGMIWAVVMDLIRA